MLEFLVYLICIFICFFCTRCFSFSFRWGCERRARWNRSRSMAVINKAYFGFRSFRLFRVRALNVGINSRVFHEWRPVGGPGRRQRRWKIRERSTGSTKNRVYSRSEGRRLFCSILGLGFRLQIYMSQLKFFSWFGLRCLFLFHFLLLYFFFFCSRFSWFPPF